MVESVSSFIIEIRMMVMAMMILMMILMMIMMILIVIMMTKPYDYENDTDDDNDHKNDIVTTAYYWPASSGPLARMKRNKNQRAAHKSLQPNRRRA